MPDGGSFSPEQGGSQPDSRWTRLKTTTQAKVGNLLAKGITQKTPEQLQAQVERFGDKGVREKILLSWHL